MTAHSRRRKLTKRHKSTDGPLRNFIFVKNNREVIVAAHSAKDAETIFMSEHGYYAEPTGETDGDVAQT